jgi:mono/diheme cytochrome c family protein
MYHMVSILVGLAVTPDTLKQPAAELTQGRQRRQVIAAILGLLLVLGAVVWGVTQIPRSDPYMREVLALAGNSDRGANIFKQNCATCHGLEAAGEVGPDLHGVSRHKSPVQLIRQVISGQTPPMPQFQPNARDMADLLAFLESL